MRKSVYGSIAITLATLWAAPVPADNGVETGFFTLSYCSAEMPLPDGTTECSMPPAYVDCLNDYLVGSHDVIYTYHNVTTASGAVHVLDTWRYSSVFHGVSSGWAWIGKGVTPWLENIRSKGGATHTYVEHQTMKPITDGQMFFAKASYILIWDLNGELVVDKPRLDDVYSCVGPVR